MVINSTLRPPGQFATDVETGPAVLTEGWAQWLIPRQVLMSVGTGGRIRPQVAPTGSNPATSATPHWSDAARGTLMASRRPVSAGFKAYCTGGRHAGHDP